MAQHEKFYLNGTWQLKKADETLLCPVEIPGSVLSGLTEHGLLEDPFYRMNEYPTRELLKNDFIFSREFELKKKMEECMHSAVTESTRWQIFLSTAC